MFVVRRPFRNLGHMLTPGSVVEPGVIKRFKNRLNDRFIVNVPEQDVDNWNAYFKSKFGVEIDVPKTDEVKTDEVTTDEVRTDEAKTDEVTTDEVRTDEAKTDEVKTDEVKPDEVKTDEAKPEPAKARVVVTAK